MRVRWLSRSIASAGPYLTLCLNEREWLAAVKAIKAQPAGRWLNEGANATAHFYVNAEGDCTVMVCIEVQPHRTPAQIAGLLVHEAVHIWQDYCRRIGETSPGDELEAYAIQHISQTLIAEMARRMEQR